MLMLLTASSLQNPVENRGLIFGLEWSPDGDYLAVAGSQGVWIYNADLQETAALEGTDFSGALAWSPDGAIFAAARVKVVETWNSKSWQHITTLEGHEWGVTSIAFSPDGQTIATGSYDQTIRFWDTGSGQPFHTLTGHNSSVRALQWSSDSQTLLSAAGIDPGSYSLEIAQWDTRQFTLLTMFRGNASLDDALTPPVQETQVKESFWRFVFEHILLSLVVLFAAIVGLISLMIYGRYRLRGAARTLLTAILTSLVTATALLGGLVFCGWLVVGSAALMMAMPGNDHAAMVFRPDGEMLAVGGWYGNDVRLWDVEAGEHVATYSVGNSGGAGIRALAWSPDANWLIANETLNGSSWVLNAQTGTLFRPENQPGHALDFSWRPDGSAVAIVYSEWYEGITFFDEGIQIWDAQSWQSIAEVTTGYGVESE
jgi:WD40 repeat protein